MTEKLFGKFGNMGKLNFTIMMMLLWGCCLLSGTRQHSRTYGVSDFHKSLKKEIFLDHIPPIWLEDYPFVNIVDDISEVFDCKHGTFAHGHVAEVKLCRLRPGKMVSYRFKRPSKSSMHKHFNHDMHIEYPFVLRTEFKGDMDKVDFRSLKEIETISCLWDLDLHHFVLPFAFYYCRRTGSHIQVSQLAIGGDSKKFLQKQIKFLHQTGLPIERIYSPRNHRYIEFLLAVMIRDSLLAMSELEREDLEHPSIHAGNLVTNQIEPIFKTLDSIALQKIWNPEAFEVGRDQKIWPAQPLLFHVIDCGGIKDAPKRTKSHQEILRFSKNLRRRKGLSKKIVTRLQNKLIYEVLKEWNSRWHELSKTDSKHLLITLFNGRRSEQLEVCQIMGLSNEFTDFILTWIGNGTMLKAEELLKHPFMPTLSH